MNVLLYWYNEELASKTKSYILQSLDDVICIFLEIVKVIQK